MAPPSIGIHPETYGVVVSDEQGSMPDQSDGAKDAPEAQPDAAERRGVVIGILVCVLAALIVLLVARTVA